MVVVPDKVEVPGTDIAWYHSPSGYWIAHVPCRIRLGGTEYSYIRAGMGERVFFEPLKGFDYPSVPRPDCLGYVYAPGSLTVGNGSDLYRIFAKAGQHLYHLYEMKLVSAGHELEFRLLHGAGFRQDNIKIIIGGNSYQLQSG